MLLFLPFSNLLNVDAIAKKLMKNKGNLLFFYEKKDKKGWLEWLPYKGNC